MVIFVSDQQDKLAIAPAVIRNVAAAALSQARHIGEVSVALVDDAEIARLNEHFLGHAGATDALAFDLPDDDSDALEGEVIVSTETAIREARDHTHSAETEVLFYVAHGMLHLCGWNDDTDEKRAAMLNEQRTILRTLGHRIDDT